MSVNFANHEVKVPKGFDLDAVGDALAKGQKVLPIMENCYVSIQTGIQEYREYVANFLEDEDGNNLVEVEYQTFPFYYTLQAPPPLDWNRSSMEEIIESPHFWDSL